MLIKRIEQVAKEAGRIMVAAADPKIISKEGHANYCTETDEKIQAFLIEKLGEVLPEAAFLGEEDGIDVFTEKMSKGFVFVLDPIDGTSNFIYGYRPSVVSIGLLRDGKSYIGVIYNPFDDIVFSAERGKGAYMNGERITASDAPLAQSLAVFGTAPYYEELMDPTFKLARALLPLCVDIRRSGTSAWDTCCVACGKCSLYFELRVQLWDYAASSVIAEEAGCMVTDISGDPLSFTGPSSIIVRSPGVKDIPEIFRDTGSGSGSK